ncbi:ComEA family DNA-binding protein [Mycolicibacterium sediminis]|uniref:DNA-binding protein n=1 Tax=Mycolicibacterium sediminis TaxID=1286180 RepID=A0A7I7QWX2_9MYCO|nr:ComEA family DNA-binding protein [Mycolicibacterium sediminis]BBY30765.1 DNA-binding protein [Mycolicibacterium sediminis]
MRLEQPTDRAHRRLGGTDAPTDDDATDADQSDTSLAKWLPDASPPGRLQWIGALRADPGRTGVVALAVVGAIAVAITVFTVAGNDPPPVASANLPPVQMVSTARAPAEPDPAQPVVVSVMGLVHRPGLVSLAAGARVDDALAAAGGALDGADLVGLNVARRLTDGEQIVVGLATSPSAPSAMGSSIAPAARDEPVPQSPADPAGPIDVNAATVEQLDDLPGVGPVTAAAIVAWRDANGPFTDVEQLGDVDGIGPVRLEKLRDLVHV